MDTWTVIILLHYLLFDSPVRSAPVGSLSSLPAAFRETAVEAKTLGEKILKDIPVAHGATVNVFSLDSSSQTSNLQMKAASMGIPSSPSSNRCLNTSPGVLVIHGRHPSWNAVFICRPLQDMCVSRMLAGVQMYQNLLEVLSSRVKGLEDLKVDLRDLLNHVNKLKEVAQLESEVSDQNDVSDLASHLQDNYNIQVALHITLTQLRSFCHDLNRTFRFLATYRQ